MKRLDVVGAVILRGGRVLCAQRAHGGPLGGKWEFPGGKVDAGETREAALVREIVEELDCDVKVGELVATTVYAYDFAEITLTTYYCDLLGSEPRLLEHANSKWLFPEELQELDWAPADIPAVEKIAEQLGPRG
ncbi:MULTISPECIES: (deoxy)nucleoside triphosphate pyrophosphohydrolase [unclassified Pseudoclavibacter]|uniref:(deoxy)nucleoside triphosphate pyrophosphohydrolase n=1 Tax=unclassified Pseudoclavibacter TaxID=2615177 RepID=UPI0027DD053B|nr:(deoxy)nucleoside triphosphate pyrophosphohydrolase [Pseudoclavibacter sp. Marseille-Q4354]